MRSFLSALLGEERPRPMVMWLTLFVLLTHVAFAQRLLKPQQPLIRAKPLPIQVALIAAAAPKLAETVTKPVAAPPKPQPPKKKPPLPVKEKPKPVLKKAAERPKKTIAKPAKIAPPVEPEEVAAEVPPVAVPAPAPVKPSPPKVAMAPKKADVFVEANYHANYGYNPKPIYPSIAKRLGWKGKVILHVQVSAAGESTSVSVQQSSGHEELDDAAVEAVKQWRFIPAKRGNTPVSSSVQVPLNFNLNY